MRTGGHIFSGVMRGSPLIEIYFHRIKGLLGIEPFKGTLDVKLIRSIDIKMFSTKLLSYKLMDGHEKMEAWFAPVEMIFEKDDEEMTYNCWAMQQCDGPYGKDIIEIISEESIKEKFKLNDGDEVEIKFLKENMD